MSKKNIKKEIENLFNKLKIKKGDNILIHSNSAGILQFGSNKKNLNVLFQVLKKKIGDKGTIVFPSYNYSILKSKLLIWSNLRSEVGLLSDFMIKNKSKIIFFSKVLFYFSNGLILLSLCLFNISNYWRFIFLNFFRN